MDQFLTGDSLQFKTPLTIVQKMEPMPNHQPDNDSADVFVELLVKHRHSLYAFIAKQLINPADAEDVFQRTSISLWKKKDTFDADGSFFHWACGFAFNEVRNFLTTQRRNKLHFDVELTTLLAEEAKAEDQVSENRLIALRECMTQLSQRQQEIMQRCYFGETSISEVAESLGRQRGALYKQIARLKDKLFECIQLRVAPSGAGQ